ncbi:cleft lip and palate transmembrane 1 family protein [Trypanosoma rangeli]|uniref:Cleft lip and palate transmembrane 1 family protein n=1 Tax=Trypanosoma rangeli TaxID=5698 RepID=A0A422MZT4_TRYRA|nr:cleft lip and palate transmembrane 1 family protein [Trypanosoma rangeli]RNE98746.1 cleft lip and palate transmembrane 1 family protein [Trypanosoma rangeli]|eukprot:RNE98746.1 cleft lip and palate transmembrane 1 family protein [Trypanosoma rangeli]
MVVPPTPNGGAEHPPQNSMWRTGLIYGMVAILIFFFLDMKGTSRTRSDSESELSGGDHAAAAEVSSQYTPFAKRGDVYSILITSGKDGVFDEDTFSDLVLDDNTGDVSRKYTVDLRRCHAENRSVILIIKTSIRGKEYFQDFPLVRYLPFRRTREKQHLFTKKATPGEDAGNTTDVEPMTVWKAYFQPSLILSPIVDFSSPLPPAMRPYYFMDNATQQYLPLIYINNFWVLRDHLVEVNATTVASAFNFTITISPRPLWKFALYVNFEASMKQHQEMGLAKPGDSDETKRIFLETNPYFLALTAIVTVLHMLFEYLAFSNDVKFWRHRSNFKGLSLRTIALNCYFQTIVFLYLLDGDETSWAILLPSGFAVLIEFWKLAQTVRVVRQDNGWWWVAFNDGYDRRTRKHDDLAVRYLMYAMTPVLLSYTVYSALYNTHRGWYSFIINTQVRFIYFFGFAMLTPQIFINYKMKSVAQLPWRTFVYRALNTVIDDLFAFIVKMPWLHRLACFRDDVVFAILLYQRWIYPVDVARGEDPDSDRDGEENKTESTTEAEANGSEVDAVAKVNEKQMRPLKDAEETHPLPPEAKKEQ